MTIDDGRYAKIISCSCGAEVCGYIGRTGKIIEEHKDGSVNLEIDGFWTHFHTKDEYVIVDPSQPEADKPKGEANGEFTDYDNWWDRAGRHEPSWSVSDKEFGRMAWNAALATSPNRELVEVVDAAWRFWGSAIFHDAVFKCEACQEAAEKLRDALAAYRGSQKS